MELVSIDENSKVHGRATAENGSVNLDGSNYNYELKDYSDIIKMGNALGWDVDIYMPNEDCTDFIVNNSFQLTKLGYVLGEDFNQDLYINKSIFEMFPVLVELDYPKLYKDVIEHNNRFTHNLQFKLSNSRILVLKQSFFKYDGNVVAITKEVTKLEFDEKLEDYLFNSNSQALLVIQDDKHVKVNDSFLKIFNFKKEDILGMPVVFTPFDVEPIYMNEDFFTEKSFYEACNKVLYHDINNASGLVKYNLNGKDEWFRLYIVPFIFNGEDAIQITFFNVTERKEAEYNTKFIESNLNILLDLSKFAICTGSLEYIEWTKQIYKIFDVNSDDYPPGFDFLKEFILPEDYEKMMELIYSKYENNPEECKHFLIDYPVRAKTKHGRIKYLSASSEMYFKSNGELDHFISFVQDRTDYVGTENEILEANNRLKDSIHEKEVLLKEVHHRVKNNLQIIVSLLTLDSRFNNDPELSLEATKNRINSMALIHEKMYNSGDLAHINLKDYIVSEVDTLFNLYRISNIKPHYELEDIDLTMEKAIPLGLIINEVVHNVIKYAFPNGENGNFRISLKYFDGTVQLIMADDGVGLPEGMDIYNSPSLGLTIINGLTGQLEGEFYQISGPGTAYGIEFEP